MVVALVGGLAVMGRLAWERDRPRRLREQAEASARAGDWPAALASWRGFHRLGPATGRTLQAEAGAALAQGRGRDAGFALERANALDPADPGPWRARLDRLRVLDRPGEALRVGRSALAKVAPGARRSILAPLTLAVLAALPDDEARATLNRWIAADPDDLDARASMLARIAAGPHPGDPDRASRIAELASILDRDPRHADVREALAIALADSGEVDRGRVVLDAWPVDARDERYDRLRARWDLDYDHRPDRAAEGYRRALLALPHDWKSRYGLARALGAQSQHAEARREAEAVARLRERLDPSTLGPRLSAALARAGDPRGAADLAALCEGVGLVELAEAWRREARRPIDPSPP